MTVTSVVSTALRVRNLGVGFSEGGTTTWAVDDVSLDLHEGECFGLIGESGSGKSTLCRAIAGLLQSGAEAKGKILLDEVDLLSLRPPALDELRRREVAMIFQEPSSYLNPVYTIGWQLREAVEQRRSPGAAGGGSITEAQALLRIVGIPETDRVLRSYPHEISGGMCQRVMIAMAIARQPRLLLADEPTTALDVTIQAQILDLLRRLIDDIGLTVLLVTHDLGIVAEVCDRVGVIYAGRIVEVGAVADIFRTPRHPYTAALLAAAPRLDNSNGDLRPTPGLGSPGPRLATTCAFSERCERSGSDCRTVRPALTALARNRAVACHRPIT
ncbi:MAG: ABC transporter ATP-binding protein [Kiloniellales bacterium]|nr:ABC transporter ATP-binding protein [Kiloniellales bacterium]